MFRIWGKIFKDTRLIADHVSVITDDDTRTHKIFKGLSEICSELDLENPQWLDKNISEFKRVKKTRFTGDNFIESVPFDYLELQIIEE